MSYEIRYTGTKAEKDAKALEDVKDYLGEKKFSNLCQALKEDWVNNPDIPPKKKVRIMKRQLAFFVGIQGYPALPLIKFAVRN